MGEKEGTVEIEGGTWKNEGRSSLWQEEFEKGQRIKTTTIAITMIRMNFASKMITKAVGPSYEKLGRIEILMELVSEGLISSKIAADKLDISEEDFCKVFEGELACGEWK